MHARPQRRPKPGRVGEGLHSIGSIYTIFYIHPVDFFASILLGLVTSALYEVGKSVLGLKKTFFFLRPSDH